MTRGIVIACACVAVASSAAADVVVLKNGNRIEGQVVMQDEKSVTVRVGKAQISVPRVNIEEIIEQDTPRELYRKMLGGLDEDDPTGHYQIALYCLKEGLNDEAIALLRRALELKPGYPEAMKRLKEVIAPAAEKLFERAGKLARGRRLAQARDDYRLLIEKYPESSLAMRAKAAIAESHFEQGNYPAAMQQWKTILNEDKQNTRAYLGAVRICEQIGQFEKAAEILDGVLRYEKNEQIRKRCRDKKAVIAELVEAKKAVEQAPDKAENYARAAEQFRKLGQMRRAVKWMERAVQKGSRDLKTVEKLARLCDEDLRVAKALKYWRYLKTLAPDRALARAADARIEQLAVLKLIPEYVRCDSADRRKEILADLEAADLPLELAEPILRRWLEFPEPEKKGILTRSVQLPGGSLGSYVLFVPESYDPGLHWPLVVALHGAGGTGDRYVFTWAQHAQQQGYLVLAPTGDQKTGWHSAAGKEIVLATLRDVRDNFNVDTNRVFIDGTSMGAGGAWEYALSAPELFAGLVSRSGHVTQLARLHLPNARNLSVYIVHGFKDLTAPADNIQSVRNELKRLEYDVEFRLDLKSGHSSFTGETPRIIRWMSARSRDPYPPEVCLTLRQLTHPSSYWLQAELLSDDVFDPSQPVKVPVVGGKPLSGEMLENYFFATAKAGMAILNGKIEGNTIRVTTKHVIGYTILLSDKMLNLDEAVEVYTNKKRSLYRKVDRSLPFMLEWARRHRDPEMIFSACARIVVPDEKR